MNETKWRFISQDMICKRIPNTYEAVMVAAREARRLNLRAKMFGEELGPEKTTTVALMRLLNGEVHYDYRPSKSENNKRAKRDG